MSPVPWLDARARITASGLLDPALIEFPNEPFAEPEGQIWLSVRDVGESLAPIELAQNGVWQETGRLFLTIMVPAGAGTLDARTLAKTLAGLFRGLPPGPVTYLDTSIGSGALVDTQGTLWGLTVTVGFRYQDIVTQ